MKGWPTQDTSQREGPQGRRLQAEARPSLKQLLLAPEARTDELVPAPIRFSQRNLGEEDPDGLNQPTPLAHHSTKASPPMEILQGSEELEGNQLGEPAPERQTATENRRWLEEQVWTLPLLDQRSADAILGYGDDGIC